MQIFFWKQKSDTNGWDCEKDPNSAQWKKKGCKKSLTLSVSERKTRSEKLMRVICQCVAISLSFVKTLFITGWLGLETFQKCVFHKTEKEEKKCTTPVWIQDLSYTHSREACSPDLIFSMCTSSRKTAALHASLKVKPLSKGLHHRKAGLWSTNKVQLVPYHLKGVSSRWLHPDQPDFTLSKFAQPYSAIC